MHHGHHPATRQSGRQRNHGADVALLGRHIDIACLMRNVGRFMDDQRWSEVPRRYGTANVEGRDHRKGKVAEDPELG